MIRFKSQIKILLELGRKVTLLLSILPGLVIFGTCLDVLLGDDIALVNETFLFAGDFGLIWN